LKRIDLSITGHAAVPASKLPREASRKSRNVLVCALAHRRAIAFELARQFPKINHPFRSISLGDAASRVSS
jgi:hypothetical protein